MKIYEALYNPSKCESASYTLSIHRTIEGAEKAIKAHKDSMKWEHDNECEMMKKEGLTPYTFEWDNDLDWSINETELLSSAMCI